MERDARLASSAPSRSEVISRSRPKITHPQRPFRARSTLRINGATETGGREHVLALLLGAATTFALALWMRSIVGTTTLAYHAVTGASAVLLIAPLGTFAWRLERFLGSRTYARLLHGAIMALFFITINAAIGLAFKMRFDSRGVHFYSLHSWVGVASLVLAKMAFADAFASHLTAACNVRSVYGFKVPTFQHVRHISAACAAGAAATAAVVLGAAQMQGRVVARSKAHQVFGTQAVAANFIAIASVATVALTVTAVRKRRAALARERDAPASVSGSTSSGKLPLLESEAPSV